MSKVNELRTNRAKTWEQAKAFLDSHRDEKGLLSAADNIHIVEDHISFVHYVERKEEKYSWLYDMPITQYKARKEILN